jgi:hypothetical protein
MMQHEQDALVILALAVFGYLCFVLGRGRS